MHMARTASGLTVYVVNFRDRTSSNTMQVVSSVDAAVAYIRLDLVQRGLMVNRIHTDGIAHAATCFDGTGGFYWVQAHAVDADARAANLALKQPVGAGL
jgi:hypothetical protein